MDTFRTGSSDTATVVNPFEVDELRVKSNLITKNLFEGKAAARKVEKSEVLSKARARCVEMRREQALQEEEAEALIAQEALVDKLALEEQDAATTEVSVKFAVMAEEPKGVMFAIPDPQEGDSFSTIPEDEVAPPPAEVLLSPSQRLSQKREISLASPSLPAFESPPSPPQVKAQPSRRPTISNECKGLLWKQVFI